jgi:hypothetical protein
MSSALLVAIAIALATFWVASTMGTAIRRSL